MSARDVFGVNGSSRWTLYEARLHIDNMVGGVPKDPDTIRKWLKARLQVQDSELLAIADATIAEMGWSQDEAMAGHLDELVDIVARQTEAGNSFKAVDGQLVWEGRCLKAALREASNVLYPNAKPWPGCPRTGKGEKETRKGLTSWFVERAEVRDRYLPLGRTVPDIVNEQRIKHVQTPKGKMHTINAVDIVEDVTITATITVLDDCIPPELWAELWEYVENGGVGADRARGDGRCALVGWERVGHRAPVFARP